MDDKALVSEIINGNMNAFKLLIKQHERLVAHMVGRLIKNNEEHEEVCQDVFLKVFDKIKEFNFQSKLSTWIATIAYRHGINALRKNKLHLTDLPDEENYHSNFVNQETPEEIFSEADLDGYVLKLIELLPPQYKLVLTLYHLQDMNYQEIGEVTGMPEGTVKNYLFRARTLLKEKVKIHMRKEMEL
jgi:RNA polymerase sigma-70 factor (ECF subfamily)